MYIQFCFVTWHEWKEKRQFSLNGIIGARDKRYYVTDNSNYIFIKVKFHYFLLVE